MPLGETLTLRCNLRASLSKDFSATTSHWIITRMDLIGCSPIFSSSGGSVPMGMNWERGGGSCTDFVGCSPVSGWGSESIPTGIDRGRRGGFGRSHRPTKSMSSEKPLLGRFNCIFLENSARTATYLSMGMFCQLALERGEFSGKEWTDS